MTRKIIDTLGGQRLLRPRRFSTASGPQRSTARPRTTAALGPRTGRRTSCPSSSGSRARSRHPAPGFRSPDNNTIYVLYLPKNVDINNGPFGGTCDNFNAYHLQSMALTVERPHYESRPSTQLPVLPVRQSSRSSARLVRRPGSHGSEVDDCSRNLITHELIEAATDPISLGGWVDNSTFNLSGDFLKEGEAADICENIGPAPDTREHRLENGIIVSSLLVELRRPMCPLDAEAQARDERARGRRQGRRHEPRDLR